VTLGYQHVTLVVIFILACHCVTLWHQHVMSVVILSHPSHYYISIFWQEARCVNVWHCDINTWRQQLFLSHIYFGQKNTLAFLITLRRRSPRETILLGHMNTSERVPRLFTQRHIREQIDWYPFGHRNSLKFCDSMGSYSKPFIFFVTHNVPNKLECFIQLSCERLVRGQHSSFIELIHKLKRK